MVNPQKENGYTAIANEIMEALAKYRLPGEQRQILDVILRKTYGFNKKWDMISNSQFVEFTGLKKSSVCRAIKSLVEKNIVYKNANNYIPSYCFNKKYNSWKVLAKKLTVSKKVNRGVTKKRPTKDNITKDNIYAQFEIFYKAYPKKKSRGKAEKTWIKLSSKNDFPSIDILLKAIEKQKMSKEWKKDNGQFIPYPSTWLNAKGWEDECKSEPKVRIVYD